MVDADSDVDTEAAVVPLDESLALLNTRWELQSFNGQELEWAPESRPLFFRVDHGSPPDLVGFGGCNRFYGTAFTATDTTVAFGAMGLTRMACPNLSGEQMFIATLSKADTWAVDGDTLTVMAGTEATLVFARAADQDDMDDAPALPQAPQ
jgi:heat shock protein HslJ